MCVSVLMFVNNVCARVCVCVCVRALLGRHSSGVSELWSSSLMTASTQTTPALLFLLTGRHGFCNLR